MRHHGSLGIREVRRHCRRNAVADIRYNTVIGHQVAYGGWQMSDVHFHDNYAIDTVYGFDIDSCVLSSRAASKRRARVPIKHLFADPLQPAVLVKGKLVSLP